VSKNWKDVGGSDPFDKGHSSSRGRKHERRGHRHESKHHLRDLKDMVNGGEEIDEDLMDDLEEED
jgi:hypothetical protein